MNKNEIQDWIAYWDATRMVAVDRILAFDRAIALAGQQS